MKSIEVLEGQSIEEKTQQSSLQIVSFELPKNLEESLGNSTHRLVEGGRRSQQRLVWGRSLEHLNMKPVSSEESKRVEVPAPGGAFHWWKRSKSCKRLCWSQGSLTELLELSCFPFHVFHVCFMSKIVWVVMYNLSLSSPIWEWLSTNVVRKGFKSPTCWFFRDMLRNARN